MNMGFHKTLGTELELYRQSMPKAEPTPVPEAPLSSHPNRVKQVLWLLAGAAIAYFLTTLGAALLWVLAAVAVGLVVLATAVCIYAQNNSW